MPDPIIKTTLEAAVPASDYEDSWYEPDWRPSPGDVAPLAAPSWDPPLRQRPFDRDAYRYVLSGPSPLCQSNPNFSKLIVLLDGFRRFGEEAGEVGATLSENPRFEVYLVGGVADMSRNDVLRKDMDVLLYIPGGDSPAVKSLVKYLYDNIDWRDCNLDLMVCSRPESGRPFIDITPHVRANLQGRKG